MHLGRQVSEVSRVPRRRRHRDARRRHRDLRREAARVGGPALAGGRHRPGGAGRRDHRPRASWWSTSTCAPPTRRSGRSGDCIGGLQLAHLASAEGGRAVENALTGHLIPMDRTVVPSCIYTHPEIATVGLNADDAKEAGYDVKLGQARFVGSGKALGEGEPDGYAQLVMDAGTGLLLGATIMGVHAVEMIHEIGVAISEGLSVARARRDHPRAPDRQRDGDGRRPAGGRRRPLPLLGLRRDLAAARPGGAPAGARRSRGRWSCWRALPRRPGAGALLVHGDRAGARAGPPGGGPRRSTARRPAPRGSRWCAARPAGGRCCGTRACWPSTWPCRAATRSPGTTWWTPTAGWARRSPRRFARWASRTSRSSSIARARADRARPGPAADACFGGLSPFEVTAAGRKVVGLSQTRRGAGALLQAGILMSLDPGLLARLMGRGEEFAAGLAAAAAGLDELRARADGRGRGRRGRCRAGAPRGR